MERGVIDELERLAALHDRGVLTEDEFQRQKAIILANSAEPNLPPEQETVSNAIPGQNHQSINTWSRKKVGCLGVIVMVIALLLLIGYCAPPDPAIEKAAKEKAAAEKAEAAENHRKGFDCLNSWDGSNDDFVAKVKEQLRDPGSFEHDKTRLAPADAKGDHDIIMDYGAKNGFGGMNRSTAVGVMHADCSATVESNE